MFPQSDDIEFVRPAVTSATAPDSRSDPADYNLEWQEYLFFRDELRHEDQLINQRLSWLISSQAFLLGGFATLISGQTPVPAFASVRSLLLSGLPISGVLGVAASYVTILAAVLHVHGVRKLIGKRCTSRMPDLQTWHSMQLRMGLVGPLVTPFIFFVFWIIILVKM